MAEDTKKGESDDKAVRAGLATVSPSCQKLTRDVEKFVYETDKCLSVVAVHVNSVSNFCHCEQTFNLKLFG